MIDQAAVDIHVVGPDELMNQYGGENLTFVSTHFRNAHRWAVNRGYETGFPTFDHPKGQEEKQVIVCLKPSSDVKRVDAPLSDLTSLQEGATELPALLVKAAFRWGKLQAGFAAGLPNFEEAVGVKGVTLLTERIVHVESARSIDLLAAAGLEHHLISAPKR